jgi:hypothetical protein
MDLKGEEWEALDLIRLNLNTVQWLALVNLVKKFRNP